ncbi:MAG: metallophosphoesterase [Chitinophagaceae bacterium]|nr:metallophosphoesterase [Anaerolineae bacterium]
MTDNVLYPGCTFIHISDTHINDDPSYSRDYADSHPLAGARALVRELNQLPFTPDFVLHTGDVAFDPHAEAYLTALEVLSEIKYPVYYVAGNHDDSPTLQRLMLHRDEPQPALHYAFEVNGVQIICVDSNGPIDPPAGLMTKSELEWLSGLCSAEDDRPLLIAVHHNVLPVGIPWLDQYMGIRNGEAFHKAILPARDRLRGVFFGHVHQNLDIVRDGILYSSTLSSWTQFQAFPGMSQTTPDRGAEPGYSIVTVTEDQTFIRRCRYPIPK